MKIHPVEYAKQVEKLGAGELLLNFIDSEGTWSGFDLDIIREITQAVNIPVIVVGGAGHLQHIQQAVLKGGASAVALGSMAVFQGQDLGVLIRFPKQDEFKKLFNNENRK